MTTKRKDIIDTQIIEGCKAKDAPCQRSLYELTVTKLYNVVYRIVLDRHKTQDVLQEVYINIFEKINQFDIQKGSIYHWINRKLIVCFHRLDVLQRTRLNLMISVFEFDE